jgi:hypothetical protein
LGAQPSTRSAAPSAVRMQVGHLVDEDEDDDMATAQQGSGVLADEPTVLLGRRDMPMLSALCRALATRLMLTAAATSQEGASGLPPSMLLCLGLHTSGDGEDDEEVRQQLLPLLERTVHAVLDV